MGTEQWMAHVNDGHLGLCSCPLGRVSCLAAMEPRQGGGGEWKGAMVAFSCLRDE